MSLLTERLTTMTKYPQWTTKNFPRMWDKYVRRVDNEEPVPLTKHVWGRNLYLRVPVPVTKEDFSALSNSLFGVDVGISTEDKRFALHLTLHLNEIRDVLRCVFQFGVKYNDLMKSPLYRKWDSTFGGYDGANPFIHTVFGIRGTGGTAGTHYGEAFRVRNYLSDARLNHFVASVRGFELDVLKIAGEDPRNIVLYGNMLKDENIRLKLANPGDVKW